MALKRSDKIAIACAIIPPLLTVWIDYLKSVPIFTTFISAITWLKKISIAFLTFKIQLWVIILTIAVLIWLLVYLVRRREKQDKARQFNYLNYKEDNINGLTWRWLYHFNPVTNMYEIKDPKAYCPLCNSPLRFKNIFLDSITECVRCSYRINGNVYGDMHKINSLIIDNIDRQLRDNISRT
jgi:ribosomal protein L37AE/L43A